MRAGQLTEFNHESQRDKGRRHLGFEGQPDEFGDCLQVSAEAARAEGKAYSISVDPSSLRSGKTPDNNDGNDQVGRHDASQPNYKISFLIGLER